MYKFKTGDFVYHRRLNQFGKFVKYHPLSDDEAYVEFTDDYGYTECKGITVSQLEYANDDCDCTEFVEQLESEE